MKRVFSILTMLALLITTLCFQGMIISAGSETIVCEAENGVLTGTTKSTSTSGYSGTGYVTGFDNDGDSVTVNANVSTAGLYTIYIRYSSPFDDKMSSLVANNTSAGTLSFPKTIGFVEKAASKATLNTGNNSIKIEKGWGYFDIDYIKIVPSSNDTGDNFSKTLVNPYASRETKALMSFLVDNYGKKVIAGQQQESWVAGMGRIDWLYQNTGKKPGLVGFDFMDYTPSRVEQGATSSDTDKAIEWYKNGGVVTFCWHWNSPKGLLQGKEWSKGFYTENTNFDVAYAMNNPDSEDYRLIIRDIDAIAVQLKRLEEAKVPVLWRPLHEADGGWFWWGAKGAEPCKKLYRLMYDRLTNYHKLSNLIWVWSFNSPLADWYPGNDVVDIVAFDSYPAAGDYGSQVGTNMNLLQIGGNKKITAITENGSIPDPNRIISEGAKWSWFCTWNGFESDSNQNNLNHVKNVFNHDYVLTLDELPDLANYPVDDVTPTSTPTQVPTPTPNIISGDVNGDKMVDSTDLTLLKRYVLKIIIEFPYDDGDKAADINVDGFIDSTDCTLLKRKILKIIA